MTDTTLSLWFDVPRALPLQNTFSVQDSRPTQSTRLYHLQCVRMLLRTATRIGSRAVASSVGAAQVGRVVAPRLLSSLSEPAYLTKPYKEIPSSIGDKATAQTAWEKSCYFKIDFKIAEDAMMYEAVQR